MVLMRALDGIRFSTPTMQSRRACPACPGEPWKLVEGDVVLAWLTKETASPVAEELVLCVRARLQSGRKSMVLMRALAPGIRFPTPTMQSRRACPACPGEPWELVEGDVVLAWLTKETASPVAEELMLCVRARLQSGRK